MTGSVTATPAPFRAGRALGWLAGFGGLGVGLSVLYATTGYGLGCPFRLVTGWDCPLCGGTRLGGALLQGDVAAAFAFNPLVFVGLVVLTALGVVWILALAAGPTVRLPEPVSRRLRHLHPTQWLLVAGTAAVAYTLLRNLS